MNDFSIILLWILSMALIFFSGGLATDCAHNEIWLISFSSGIVVNGIIVMVGLKDE